MRKKSEDPLEDVCICGHTKDSHMCTDPGCQYFGQHTEYCPYPTCDCRDYLAVEERFPSVTQATKGIDTDLARHESVDAETRQTSFADIRAAYEDRYDRKWFSDLPRGIQRRWRNR